MLENKGCSNELNPNIDFSCDAEWEGLGKETNGEIFVIGNYDVQSITSEIIRKEIEDQKTIFPFNRIYDSMKEAAKIYKEVKEKAKKRNFVNKFNKNQHKK